MLKKEMEMHKVKALFYVVFLTFLIIGIIASLIGGKWFNAATFFFAGLLMSLPIFFNFVLKIKLPTLLELIIISFIFSAYVLGEVNGFYTKIPFWDTILHSMSGFIFAGIGFGFVEILNRNTKNTVSFSPIFVVLFSFCFSLATGVVWEFIEFSMDTFFGMDMQKDTILNSIHSYKLGNNSVGFINDINDVTINGKSIGSGYIDLGIIDTMKDLLLNTMSAIIFNVLAIIYLKTDRKHAKFIENFIPFTRTDI